MKQFFGLLLMLPFFAEAQMTFTPMAAGLIPPGYLINNIFSLNDNEVWASASSSNGNLTNLILKTTDKGKNWSVFEPNTAIKGYCDDIYVVNISVAYVVLEDISGDVYTYRTSNGGNTWKDCNLMYGIYMHAFSPSTIVSIGGAHAYYSTDSFNTFTDVPYNQGGPPLYTPFSFNALSGAQLQCTNDSGLYFGYNRGSIIRTQDKGHKWSAFRTTLDTSTSVSSLACSGNTMLALKRYSNNKGGLSRSTDAGHTWVNQSDSIPTGSEIQTISSSPTRANYFLLGGYSNIFESTNGGISWKKNSLPASLSCTGTIHISSDSIAWIGGDISALGNAALYKVNLGNNISVVDRIILPFELNIYPNPSNGIFNYKTNQHCSIKIQDMNGRTLKEINTLSDNGSIDLNEFCNGIYTVYFTNENCCTVRKIVKQFE